MGNIKAEEAMRELTLMLLYPRQCERLTAQLPARNINLGCVDRLSI